MVYVIISQLSLRLARITVIRVFIMFFLLFALSCDHQNYLPLIPPGSGVITEWPLLL